jgi:hypothetical protein
MAYTLAIVPNGPQMDATLARMTIGYLTCALWSSNDESNDQGGDPLDQNYEIGDIAPCALATLTADCAAFLEKFGELAAAQPAEPDQFGHDLWLTRCGHGTGFWDRDAKVYAPEARDAFDAFAEAAGNRDLYVGDDGLIYVM